MISPPVEPLGLVSEWNFLVGYIEIVSAPLQCGAGLLHAPQIRLVWALKEASLVSRFTLLAMVFDRPHSMLWRSSPLCRVHKRFRTALAGNLVTMSGPFLLDPAPAVRALARVIPPRLVVECDQTRTV